MNGKTKTMTLDACVNGDVTHLTQLVGDEYDQFSTFFQIFKNIPTDCHQITYIASKELITFHVDCDKMETEEFSELKKTYGVGGISIETRDQGISVNIPIR